MSILGRNARFFVLLLNRSIPWDASIVLWSICFWGFGLLLHFIPNIFLVKGKRGGKCDFISNWRSGTLWFFVAHGALWHFSRYSSSCHDHASIFLSKPWAGDQILHLLWKMLKMSCYGYSLPIGPGFRFNSKFWLCQLSTPGCWTVILKIVCPFKFVVKDFSRGIGKSRYNRAVFFVHP